MDRHFHGWIVGSNGRAAFRIGDCFKSYSDALAVAKWEANKRERPGGFALECFDSHEAYSVNRRTAWAVNMTGKERQKLSESAMSGRLVK